MWPLEVRERCTQRLLSRNPPMMSVLSKETGIPASTLFRWKEEARNPLLACHADLMTDRPDRRPTDWPPTERLRVLTETASLGEDELGEYLRREGLHSATLEDWRSDALAGLGGTTRGGKRGRGGKSRRERELERELRRKEKALAEAAALLVLQKKARQLFGEDEDDSSDGT